MVLLAALCGGLLLTAAVAAGDTPLVEHVQRGERLASAGQLEDAIREYEAARRAGAGSAMFLNRLGTLYLRASSPDSAAAVLKLSLAEKPDQLPVYSKLGEAYVAQGRLDSAIHYVRAALQVAPQSSTIYSSLAFLVLQQKPTDLPLARTYLDSALALDAKNPEAYRYLGFYYTQVDSTASAIGAYTRVTELMPEHFEAYNNLGYLHLAKGDFTAALDYYEQARARTDEAYLLYAIDERMRTARAMLAGDLRARYLLVRERPLATDLLQRIRGGESLGRLAVEHSIAPNAREGGDTGFFRPGDLMPAVEAAVMALEVGQVSDLVELEAGYLIVQRLH